MYTRGVFIFTCETVGGIVGFSGGPAKDQKKSCISAGFLHMLYLWHSILYILHVFYKIYDEKLYLSSYLVSLETFYIPSSVEMSFVYTAYFTCVTVIHIFTSLTI